jgi:hypothetical protein
MVLEKPLFNTLEAADLAAILTMENLPIHMVAGILNVTRLTLAQWRQHGGGPPFMLIRGGGIVYPRASFQRFLQSRREKESAALERNQRKHLRKIFSEGGIR